MVIIYFFIVYILFALGLVVILLVKTDFTLLLIGGERKDYPSLYQIDFWMMHFYLIKSFFRIYLLKKNRYTVVNTVCIL